MQVDDEIAWRGCSMEEIYRYLNVFELKHIVPIRPSAEHAVLYHFPIVANPGESPKPQKGHNKWDAFHVRLPCSSKSQYPVTNENGTTSIESRWEMIEKALLRPIRSSKELEDAILSYNSKYENIWKFRSLHKFFDEMEEDEIVIFFEELLPKIIRLALRLPELIQTAIPLLKQGQNKSISLSQQQCSCLIANAFLCTFPRRNSMKKKSEYSSFPDINFNRLFQSTGPQVLEKIKCIFHYFRRVCNQTPTGILTFTRRSIPLADMPKWDECNAPIGVTPLHITSIGTIEDQGIGLLQVDFANKFLGGGVLGSGCVQEEIRFVICPELIISKLFTECLRPNEALLMIGAEQYSLYKGYASSFEWDGNHEDIIPFDESYRRECHIVAIDALHFVHTAHQYREELLLREMNKAYVGFFHPLETAAPGIASGNWGCGAFRGEAMLKALIQLMACTLTKRPLVYYTFGNEELRDEVHKIHTFFIEENVKVRELWLYLREFGKEKLKAKDLYDFIRSKHLNKDDDSINSILPKLTKTMSATATTSQPVKRNRSPSQSPKPSVFETDALIRNKNGSILEENPELAEIKKSTEANNMSEDLFDLTDSSPDVPQNHIDMLKSPNIHKTESIIEKSKEPEPAKKSKQPTLHEMLDSYYYKKS